MIRSKKFKYKLYKSYSGLGNYEKSWSFKLVTSKSKGKSWSIGADYFWSGYGNFRFSISEK